MNQKSQTAITQALSKKLNIPTLPVVVMKVKEMIEDPDCGTNEIGQLIAQDAPLAAKVLRIANSAYYGLKGQCVSTEHASTVLGVRVLRNIVTQVAVMNLFDHLDDTKGFNINDLWDHAILTAQVSQSLARCAKQTTILSPEEHYVCGLLHDVGKVVLLDNMGADYLTVVQAAMRQQLPLHVVERQHLSFDHTEVGSVVAARWGLPTAVSDAIQYHHGPDDKIGRSPVVALAAHANSLAHCISEGNLAAASSVFDEQAQKLLGITSEDVDAIVQKSVDQRAAA